jgi:cobalt/nickel transport system permease protein
MATANLLAAVAVAASLRTIDYERIPRIGVLAAVFFMASLIHINIGPSSVHLLLNGLLGLLLGAAALPALAVALFLQVILFGFGGVSALGANLLGMGLPAVLTGWMFARRCRCAPNARAALGWGMLAGGTSVVLTCLSLAVLLNLSNPQAYATAVKALLIAHLPVVFTEAVVVGAAVRFLYTVRADLLDLPQRATPSCVSP